AARNIELLHESGNSNKRDRDGNRVQNIGQGQQEIRGRSSGQRRSTETLPPPPLCSTYGKPHPGVCYKATGECFTCGSTQHNVKDCPQGKQKQSMSTDLSRLPPTTGRVYATTRGQAAKTSENEQHLRIVLEILRQKKLYAKFSKYEFLLQQVGGDAFADTCTWVAFREIFYNRYFPASEQQRYEHEYGSICQLDRENTGEYMERFTRLASFVGAAIRDVQRLRLPLVTSSYCMRAGIRISGIEMVIGFRTEDKVNRRSGVVMTRVNTCIGVVRTRVLSIGVVRIERSDGRNGNDRQGQGNYNHRQHRNQSTWDFNQGRALGSSGQRRSTETLP
nr:zinc finger, CCHC-type, retrotransposon Gag domain protein [Tanacetum cinerariifolium]